MAFCSKCGTQMGDVAAFCPSCGERAGQEQQQQYQQYQQPPNQQQQYQQQYQQPPNQQQYQQQSYQQPYQQPVYQGGSDAANNKAMGILAYIGILVLVPIFAAKDSQFARYHANQGLVLAIAEVACMILSTVLTTMFAFISLGLTAVMGIVFMLLWLGFLVLVIIGIVNAAKGEMKPLPLIGGITILK